MNWHIGFIAAGLVLTGPAAYTQPVQFGQIVQPDAGVVVTGIQVVIAEQTNLAITPYQVGSARLQGSQDSTGWITIDEITSLSADPAQASPYVWRFRWDPAGAVPGSYWLRVRFELLNGLILYTPAVSVIVNKPPVARASATLTGSAVTFDGQSSFDPDGSVVEWDWDFGDGTTGAGPVVTHTYPDMSQQYDASLDVVDVFGAHGRYFFTVSFPGALLAPAGDCVCQDITVRGIDLSTDAGKKAVGPNGNGGQPWTPTRGKDDGQTLGPLDKNPGNAVVNGEKKHTGYAFEILAKVKGSPDLCKEIQLIKGTNVYQGQNKKNCDILMGTLNADNSCTVPQKWKGATADLDKDGTVDIDVSTQAKCAAQKGVWDAKAAKCTLKFPQDGNKYAPDQAEAGKPGGAYEQPFVWKEHPGDIVWSDAPSFAQSPNGTTSKLDFIALIRGTDKKYCYASFSVDLMNQKGPDKEDIKLNKKEVGVAAVPGVP